MADKKISIFVEAVVAGAKRKLKEVENSLKGLGKTTKATSTGMTQEMGKLEQAGKVLEGAFRKMGVLIVAYLARMAIQGIVHLSRMAAKNMDLADSYASLAARYHLASGELLDALDKAARGTVDKFSLMLAANKAMRLGVATTVEDFEKLMKIAAVRAKEFGITTTQAFDTIIDAVGRTSPMIAAHIGILLDADATYKEHAQSIGKTAAELDVYEQKQALLNAILQEGAEDLDNWGDMTVTAATKIERYDAAVIELGQTIGEFTAGPVTDLMEKLTTLPVILDQLGYIFGVNVVGMKASWSEFLDLLEQRDFGAILAGQTGEAFITAQKGYALLDHAQKSILPGMDALAAKLGRIRAAVLGAGAAHEDLAADTEEAAKAAEKAADAWASYYDRVAQQGRTFTRRMEDMAFQQTQAEENAARRRFEILQSNQRSIENAQTTFNLRQRSSLEDHQVTLSRMRRDYLDDQADMEYDYQDKVRDLQKRAPWWIRQALQEEFQERARIAATGDREALARFDEALRERIRQIDPVYAEELDELEEHYRHQQEIEQREHGQSYTDRQEDYQRDLQQQQRELERRLRDLRQSLDDQLDSWRFQQQQRHETEARAMERLRQENAYQLAQMERSLNEKLAEINSTYEHWGWTHGISYVTALNEALSLAGPQFTPYDPSIPFPEEWTGFQRGTPYVPSNMMALLHKGEMVVPAGPAERMREGGITVSIENLTIGPGASPANIRQLAEEMGVELGRGIRQGYR